MTLIKEIFFSTRDHRLRAGWRISAQSIIMLVLIGCLLLPFPLSLEALTSSSGLLWIQGAQFVGITLSIYLARRFLDKQNFISLGLRFNRKAVFDLLVGVFIAFLMMLFVFGVEISFGWVRFDAYAWELNTAQTVLGQTLITLTTFILVGWSEELLSRGYQLQNITSGLNLTWGVILSSAIFSALHLANFNATWAGAAGIFFAGIFFAFSYLQTKQLWLPIGLHIGWNFFEGVVFGFPVSGMEFFRLIHISVKGPELWTGGPFGPEAGLVLVPALILGIVLIHTYIHLQEEQGFESGYV